MLMVMITTTIMTITTPMILRTITIMTMITAMITTTIISRISN